MIHKINDVLRRVRACVWY